MSPRSLPERTVDAWVAAAVCARFEHARIWAPTQAAAENWDYGIALGDGKIFILEDKGTTPISRKRRKPLETHRIDIDRRQLRWYCSEVEATWELPVYYVLPQPPWPAEHTGPPTVPHQAICRTDSPSGRFERWAFVSRCHDLRTYLGARRSIETDQLPLPGGSTLADFLRLAGECRIGRVLTGSGEASEWAAKSAEGRSEPPPPQAEVRAAPLQGSKLIGSALAVFIPAQDLSAWPY